MGDTGVMSCDQNHGYLVKESLVEKLSMRTTSPRKEKKGEQKGKEKKGTEKNRKGTIHF